MMPGAMQLDLTPQGPISTAMLCDNVSMAALAADAALCQLVACAQEEDWQSLSRSSSRESHLPSHVQQSVYYSRNARVVERGGDVDVCAAA